MEQVNFLITVLAEVEISRCDDLRNLSLLEVGHRSVAVVKVLQLVQQLLAVITLKHKVLCVFLDVIVGRASSRDN